MNLPSRMKAPDCHRWLLWKLIPENDKNKKPRKVPYYANGQPRRGNLDSPEDLSFLVSFEEAQSALGSGKYTGLGFALGSDGHNGYWQGIDLDAISDKPKLQELKSFLPGYVEISPSGNGVHAIGYGRQFKSMGSNKSGIEAYCSGRYETIIIVLRVLS
jgi:primase-polymerase (primpol)-like protein